VEKISVETLEHTFDFWEDGCMNLPTALDQLATAAGVCADAARSSARALTDAELMELQGRLAGSARLVEVAAGALAAEVAVRSRRELGYDGLAQRMGARTPEKLVQHVTGVSGPTAGRMVRVGSLIADLDGVAAGRIVEAVDPWLAAAVSAVAAGSLTAEALEAIRAGVGRPAEDVPEAALTAAVVSLVDLAGSVTLEVLAARAREARDLLDAAGIADREAALRDRRYLRLTRQHDGMTRIAGLLDPESAAVIVNAVDAATGPGRGGPRFVDPDEAERARLLENDPRTPEQLCADALVDLIDIAVRADKTILGKGRAPVRILVTARDLHTGAGAGHIEGQTAPVSIGTVHRIMCDGGHLPVLFSDDGQALNVGQTQRLHTARQRAAISARDGGCIADCDRPPAWCEVHHINEFSKGGSTSVEDGVLLCKHHHMLIHNNGWRVKRVGDQYHLHPPPGTGHEPIPLHSKSPAHRRMLAGV
jgi:hypothetical protein